MAWISGLPAVVRPKATVARSEGFLRAASRLVRLSRKILSRTMFAFPQDSLEVAILRAAIVETIVETIRGAAAGRGATG
jgi:hypothetical protein